MKLSLEHLAYTLCARWKTYGVVIVIRGMLLCFEVFNMSSLLSQLR